ncbi:hypothetical protein LJR030_005383 [Rhizobium sp. LjRoot30]|uniref:hypothetical protein n=1 Tax=Rhizobium sp. LjRoot30 TaxID=3342320 RepID=UPI003ECDD1A2
MPKPTTAVGEAMPTIDRRTLLLGLVATAVRPAEAGAARHDPLLDLIKAYRQGVIDFYAETTDQEWEGLSDITYGPHLARIDRWEGPAVTREGAIEALRLSIDDVGGVADCDSAERMVRAAIGYLESLPA